jgi:ABC-type phosphate/phosphonate transport system permease subunit
MRFLIFIRRFEVNVKSSIVAIIGGAVVILGCGALAFAGLLAWLAWGGCQANGSCDFTLPEMVKTLRHAMAISAVSGVGAIALGFWLRHLKGASKGGR